MVEAVGEGCDLEPRRGRRRAAFAQPFAGAMLTVGSSVLFGAGSSGSGPMPASTGSVAVSPQAASPRSPAANSAGVTALVIRSIRQAAFA